MEFTFQPSPPLPLFFNAPFLFPSFITPENYVHWTETPESHVYTADLPGVRKEEIKVEVEDSKYLIIRTEATNGILTVTVPRIFSRRRFRIDPADLPDRHEILAPAA
ncbi:Alpha crystallin/Hsp20 domain [Macleaya cordata]|uniref:Alpha crystallin/Hsp20 domain n=1 Tax=Macleaya cordata TaxID=56857 RepID=A0A200Q6L9_MACCD|nr:Alpha crystallin/Hsp20 domain [Macleaya cordata]